MANTAFQVDWEIPVRIRPYEKEWNFSGVTVRANILLEDDRSLGDFSWFLEPYVTPHNTVTLECIDLFESDARIESTIGKSVQLLKEEYFESQHEQPLPSGVALKYADCSFSWQSQIPSQAYSALAHLQPIEWYGAIWPTGSHHSLILSNWLHEKNLRLEQTFIERVGELRLAFFIAPNHRHMEVMFGFDPLCTNVRSRPF
jgi:hypothetical protein